jgi:8-oxo-dGTP diphosphatase
VKDRFKAILSVYLVLINDNNEILLALRNNTGYCDGYYGLVSGHVEKNETILDAIIREAKEEAGIVINKSDLSMSCVMYRRSPDRDCMDFFIKATRWEGAIINAEPHKCDELRFFDLKNLPNNLIEYVKKGLDCTQNNVFYIEYGW